MAVVEVKGIKKHFDKVKAVDGVDLSTEKGEFLVILGPSGCGKTTLMRMIAGLERPTAGDVLIGGEVVTELPPRARDIAMVFQSYALYPHLSVFNNIAFPLKAKKVPKQAIREKVKWATSLLSIQDLLDRKPRHLSGGERQRVALARAMVKEPAVLLLDEPLSNLDAKLRVAARDELQQFQWQMGITTVFVTHDQIEAMGLGDRIVVMNQGKIKQIGSAQEIYNEPADTFVATFLGSPPMNLLEQADGLLGFRPEHFLPKEVVSDHDNLESFTFSVTRVEYLGSDQLLYGTLDGTAQSNTKIIAKLPSTVTVPIEPGQEHEFVIQKKHLKLFDKTTGLAADGV